MNPWLETLGVTGVAALGGGLGWACSRIRGWGWMVGYLVPLSGVALRAVAIRQPAWTLHPWLSWQWSGQWSYGLCAALVAMLFAALIPQLPKPRDRRALGVLIAALVGYLGIWPALSVALSRDHLAGLKTVIWPDGVCRQSTEYTCGPAAAVTGLGVLGLRAEEGILALRAGTSPATGTPPQTLARVLNEQFGAQGLRAELRAFDSTDALTEEDLPALVLVRFSLLLDHWLVITGKGPAGFSGGDPLSGPMHLTAEELRQRWRGVGIVLRRTKW